MINLVRVQVKTLPYTQPYALRQRLPSFKEEDQFPVDTCSFVFLALTLLTSGKEPQAETAGGLERWFAAVPQSTTVWGRKSPQ